MARRTQRTNKVQLTEEEKELRTLILDNKEDLIDSKEYFDVGVDDTVLRARIVGAGNKAVKFSFNIGGISKKSKATPSEFFLDYPELDDNLVCQIEDFLGEVAEEILEDANITRFTQPLPAK